MLFNHLKRLKIIFNQLGLLCQFKELLMRAKFVNSLWAAFFCGRGEEGIRKVVLEVAIISLYQTLMKPIPSLSISEFTKSSTAIISHLRSMSFPKLNPWQLKIENRKGFCFFVVVFLNSPIWKWERAGPLQDVKQPSSPHPPPVCLVNYSLIFSLSLPGNITCFLCPQDDKQAPVWGLTLPSLTRPQELLLRPQLAPVIFFSSLPKTWGLGQLWVSF